MPTRTQTDNRQIVQRAALPMIGNVANEAESVLLPRVDAELGKLFEDRNIQLVDGGSITFTGTQLQFTENLVMVINGTVGGENALSVIILNTTVTNTKTFTNNGDTWYANITRVLQSYTGTTTIGSPSLTSMSSTVGITSDGFTSVSGVGIPIGTYVTNVVGSTITMSQNANSNATGAGTILTFSRCQQSNVLPVDQPFAQVNATQQEQFIIARRKDAADGTQRIYFRNGFSMSAGQTLRLGQGGGSGGSGTGDDLDSLLFRADLTDTFQENSSNALSSIDGSAIHTNATFNAAKNMYAMLYDAGRTSTGASTTTNIVLDAVVSGFTAATGDIILIGGVARKITTVTSQSNFTTTEAFPTAPANGTQVTISQAVYTKDIYNLAVDGATLASGFPASTFSEIMVDYRDNATIGSNVFTLDVAPVVAYTATNDNSNFTTSQVRATNITDTTNSVFLPSSGSNLYLRFFANKTSGSGTVNLLMYKAFMQKLTASVAGGITNSAYAFTNSVGTPINCSVSVVGGKTTLTLTWQYAVGVLSGTTASSIEVWLNGQKLPRFVNSTLTPDGSFVETTTNVVTLDRDYSAQNLNVEIFQRTQIVDTSTTNTSAISFQQEIMQNGFQGFVAQNQLINATSTTGTPAAGTFYSSITGRAAIVDFSQDLKPRMGVERIMVQTIYQSTAEFGPNGEAVWLAPNDTFGQIRYIGPGWTSTQIDAYGQRLSPSTSFTDSIEITFYGTGLNLLMMLQFTGNAYTISVDGVSVATNQFNAAYGLVLGNRNYSTNNVVNAVSNLTLGIHTVTIKNTASGGSIYGFEILNESSSVKTQPGVSYLNGQKLVLSAQSAISYSANVTGTRGGRVLHYQKSDGTIGQSFQAVNGSQLNLTSTDHTNEEVVRVYNYREFGASRITNSDDFNTLTVNSNNTNRAFALDDGTTALFTDASFIDNSGDDGLNPNSTNNFITLQFIGTGLDIFCGRNSIVNESHDIFIDGTAIATNSTTCFGTQTYPHWVKIVSGLPYGTHTCRVVRKNNVANGVFIAKYAVYQPKKPSLPSGAVELADYNVMATYVANTTLGANNIGTGVLRKNSSRELLYIGTTWIVNSDVNSTSGFVTSDNNATPNAGDVALYTFFGTGVEYRFKNPGGGCVATLSIDGQVNLTVSNSSPTGGIGWTGSLTTATALGSTTYSNTTGTITYAGDAAQGNGISVSGLPLGLHTIKISYVSNTGGAVKVDCFDVVTPIHSVKSNIYADLQNSLPVGSNAISDNRKITPVKDILPATKAWTQAIGVTSSPTTTSTNFIPVPDLSCTIKTTGGPLKISYTICNSNNGANQYNAFSIYVDGISVSTLRYETASATGQDHNTADSVIVPVSAGAHKVEVYWRVGSGTGTLESASRTLTVEEK